MNQKNIIKKQIQNIGTRVYLQDADWYSTPFKAYITHLWRRKSSAFEPEWTELGSMYNQYYLYIGPYDHDIKALSDAACVIIGNDKYEFKCRDAVEISGKIIYYTGIMRKLLGNEDEIYEN